ncbi:putative tetratricopeptide-like helical domain superfamily, TRAPP III complex, Trs85 [Dioscorea sansibarensis]
MDPINSVLGKLLVEEISPVVMVLSTPFAEQACAKNGLNFVEMLSPFSIFSKIDVPVRTASDQPYRLQMFKLRLVYASDIHQQNYEATVERLKQVVSDASEKISDLQSDPPQLEDALQTSASDYPSLWIRTFNKELLRTMSFSEHEAFDHPVACLLVVSSKDERPINKFVDLFNTDQLPSLLNEGAMDPKILKHYLLLHDVQDGALEKATNILANMRGTFGSNDCKLLCINSSQDGLVEWQNNPWAPYANAPSDRDVGCFLNVDDLNEIKDFMQNLTSKHVIPQMEQKIRILNQQVSATRKGFRNQIKNLWWRKGKEDSPDTSNGPMYTFSSIESQIRVLGDYAFMLRDYELALSNYRLLSTDYKLDKAWKRYAGVQEMMGLSYFMLDQSRKESEYCMESAFNTYLKLGSSGQRNATRCGLWWTEMLKARGQFKEAAGIYFRISSEEPSLHAAVMLEQASYCYLFSNPPMLRKYGFHLVLAGNRYYISDQRQHAIRAYKNALFVYKGNGWNYISDHVHFNIGRWYAFLGIFDVAVKHMQGVLACKHQSLITQDLFLNDFLHAAQNLGKILEVNELQLPVIDMSSLRVIYEDHRTYASSADVSWFYKVAAFLLIIIKVVIKIYHKLPIMKWQLLL